MSILALTAPTTYFGDPEIVAGLNITDVSGTSIAGATGFTIPWTQGLMFLMLTASGNTVTLTFVNPVNSAYNFTTGNLTAAKQYIFGPIPSYWQSGATGLVSVNITGVVTGITLKTYLVPPLTGVVHNPFQVLGANAADF